jgi:hypothetical protein
MWAQPITIAFQQKDISLFTTSAAASSSIPASPTSPASFTTSASSSSPTISPSQTQTPNPVISTGDIAGIVVGVVALLAIVIGALLFYQKRKAASPSRNSYPVEIHNAQEGYSEATKSGHTPQDPSWDRSIHKDPADFRDTEPIELPNYSSTRRHELA